VTYGGVPPPEKTRWGWILLRDDFDTCHDEATNNRGWKTQDGIVRLDKKAE